MGDKVQGGLRLSRLGWGEPRRDVGFYLRHRRKLMEDLEAASGMLTLAAG